MWLVFMSGMQAWLFTASIHGQWSCLVWTISAPDWCVRLVVHGWKSWLVYMVKPRDWCSWLLGCSLLYVVGAMDWYTWPMLVVECMIETHGFYVWLLYVVDESPGHHVVGAHDWCFGVGAPAYCAWSLYAVDAHSWVYMVDACSCYLCLVSMVGICWSSWSVYINVMCG